MNTYCITKIFALHGVEMATGDGSFSTHSGTKTLVVINGLHQTPFTTQQCQCKALGRNTQIDHHCERESRLVDWPLSNCIPNPKHCDFPQPQHDWHGMRCCWWQHKNVTNSDCISSKMCVILTDNLAYIIDLIRLLCCTVHTIGGL